MGVQFQNAADAMVDNPLQGSFRDAELLETDLRRLREVQGG